MSVRKEDFAVGEGGQLGAGLVGDLVPALGQPRVLKKSSVVREREKESVLDVSFGV